MADKKDFYDVLGVNKGVGDDELKKAYRREAKKFHPDLNPGDKGAEAKFKEVNEAYEVLSDKDKRSKYDQFGHAGVDPNFGGYGGYGGSMDFDDLSDIFGSMFSGFGFGGSTRARNPNAPIRGNDVRYGINLSFMEAAKGCAKEVSVTRLENCDSCSGSGASKGTSPESCADCGGSGQIRVQQKTPFGVMQSAKSCPRCSGKGKIIKKPCGSCSGAGRVRNTRKIDVNVPAGIDDGQTFVLRSQGDHGINGGPAGDVGFTVTVRPDPIFVRDGFDVWCDIPVTFTQAVLGGEITVPTIDGKVKYNVPEGTQTATTFRLRNKGIPYVNGKGRGEQYVRVNVEVPKNLSGKQKDALKEFEKLTTDKNYEKRKSFFDKIKDAVMGEDW